MKARKGISRRQFLSGPLGHIRNAVSGSQAETSSLSDYQEGDYDSDCADFDGDMIRIEIMRMGMDPASMSEEAMRKILKKRMNESGS